VVPVGLGRDTGGVGVTIPLSAVQPGQVFLYRGRLWRLVRDYSMWPHLYAIEVGGEFDVGVRFDFGMVVFRSDCLVEVLP
jgi:hypothetical protein